MPIGTAVHERTLKLCESLNYREWSGYYAVSVYEMHHEHEYNALRNACGLIDISPLFKYLLKGRDATKLLNRVMTRDVSKMAPGQVIYTPWCDEAGKIIDDGTVSRLDETTYRMTAADPNLRWLRINAIGMDVAIDDISEKTAALALQGPTSGKLLKKVAQANVANLKYFRVTRGTIAGVPVDISRTGYTGDLGYEIWIPWGDAVKVWDALMDEVDWTEVEKRYEEFGLTPSVPSTASRTAVPVYAGSVQAGKATSTTWSPLLKKMIALASLASEHAAKGTTLDMEMTIEAVRQKVGVKVVDLPFFNPPRKTATPV